MSYEMSEYLHDLEKQIYMEDELKKARAKALEEGIKQGTILGHQEGHKKGLEEGTMIAHKEGLEEGTILGRKEGTKKAKYDMVVELNRKNISEDIISEVTKLNLEEVKKIIKEYNK